MNFPGPWWYAIPGAIEETLMFVVYLGIELGLVGIVTAVWLWILNKSGACGVFGTLLLVIQLPRIRASMRLLGLKRS